MKYFWIIIQILGLTTILYAQDTKSFTVKSGQSIADVLSFDDIFRYPEFSQGDIIYKDGTKTVEKVNYNNVFGKMMYINNRGDTMVIANSDIMDSILVNQDIFHVVSDNYYLQLAGNDAIELVSRKNLKLIEVKKASAYGTTSSTFAIESYSSFIDNATSNTYNLKVNDDIVYAFEVNYYFLDQDRELQTANRRSLLKIFPEKSDLIKQFLRSNSIKFDNEEDLLTVANYVSELQ